MGDPTQLRFSPFLHQSTVMARLHTILTSVLLVCLPTQARSVPLPQWSGWGGNIFNNRFVPSAVSADSIQSIAVHCRITFPNGVSATPSIAGDVAYFPTYSGLFVAYDYQSCATRWQTNITSFLNKYAAVDRFQAAVVFAGSRTSPQLDLQNNVIYIGTQLHALLLALDMRSGAIVGHIQVNPHPLAIVTMSPTFYNGQVFLGTSSSEESAAVDPTYPCCSFVGNFAAFSFDGHRFTTHWNRTMLPEPYGVGEWSGGAVWGSQPAIDIAGNQVFIATGNVYAIPVGVQACINSTGNDNETACYPPTVWQEAVIAFDITSGIETWVRPLSALDAWTLACGLKGLLPPQPTCPPDPGPDADFGMAPSFVSHHSACTPHGRDVVVVGQKSGFVYAIDAANGTIYWSTLTGPDSSSSGALLWGVAVDEAQVYFTTVNPGLDLFTLQPSGLNITNSAYGAIELDTGKFVWEVPVPGGYNSFAPPTVTNDIVLVGDSGFVGPAGSANDTGSVVVLNKHTGEILQQLHLDSVIYGGVAVSGRFVMTGSGYAPVYQLGHGSFYVYEVDSRK